MPEPKPEGKGAEYVSMAEFALVDNLRVISFLAICLSCSIIHMGKSALRASWRLKADFTKKVFKRSLMRIAFIAICAIAIRHFVKDSIMTVKKQVGIKEFSSFNKTSHMNKKHHHSRKLSELDEEDFEDEDFEDEDFENDDFEVDFKKDSEMRKFMDIIKGEIKEAEDKDDQDVETA